jgi:hypothetical protein
MDKVHVMTRAYLEPWIGNVIDLTLSDGSHRVGLLQKVDDQWAQLHAGAGKPALLDGGKVRIADTVLITRAAYDYIRQSML